MEEKRMLEADRSADWKTAMEIIALLSVTGATYREGIDILNLCKNWMEQESLEMRIPKRLMGKYLPADCIKSNISGDLKTE